MLTLRPMTAERVPGGKLEQFSGRVYCGVSADKFVSVDGHAIVALVTACRGRPPWCAGAGVYACVGFNDVHRYSVVLVVFVLLSCPTLNRTTQIYWSVPWH